MNCKQGDLAIVVRSLVGNVGKIVRCVRLHASEYRDLDDVPFAFSLGPRWVIDPPLPSQMKGGAPATAYTVADAHLRPLRGLDTFDEALRLVGKPEAVTA